MITGVKMVLNECQQPLVGFAVAASINLSAGLQNATALNKPGFRAR